MSVLPESTCPAHVQKIWLHDTETDIKLRGYINWGENMYPNTLNESDLAAKKSSEEPGKKRERVVVYVGNYHSKLGGNSHHIVTKSLTSNLNHGYYHQYTNSNRSFGEDDVVVSDYAYNNDSDDEDGAFVPISSRSTDEDQTQPENSTEVTVSGSKREYVAAKIAEMEADGKLERTDIFLSADVKVTTTLPDSHTLLQGDDKALAAEVKRLLALEEARNEETEVEMVLVRVNLRGHTNNIDVSDPHTKASKAKQKLAAMGSGSSSWLGLDEVDDIANILHFVSGIHTSCTSIDGTDGQGSIDVYDDNGQVLNRDAHGQFVDLINADHVYVIGLSFSCITITNTLNHMYSRHLKASSSGSADARVLDRLRGVVLVSPPYSLTSFMMPSVVDQYHDLVSNVQDYNARARVAAIRDDRALVQMLSTNKTKNPQPGSVAPDCLYTSLLGANKLPLNFMVDTNVLLLHGDSDQVTSTSRYTNIFNDVDSHYKFLLSVPDSDHFYGKRDHLLTGLVYTYLKTSLQYTRLRDACNRCVSSALASRDNRATQDSGRYCYICKTTCKHNQPSAPNTARLLRQYLVYNNMWMYLLLFALILLRSLDFGDEEL